MEGDCRMEEDWETVEWREGGKELSVWASSGKSLAFNR